jgi:hypothetical protein
LSIVPFEDNKKRVIVLPSFKTREFKVQTSINQVPRSTRKIHNVSKALEKCREERAKLQEIIKMGSDNVLSNQVKHLQYIVDSYTFDCYQTVDKITFLRCIARRKNNECNKLCPNARRFIGL